MEKEFKVGDIVFEYSPMRRADCIKPREIIRTIETKGEGQKVVLEFGSEQLSARDVYKNKAELVARLIYEDKKRSQEYIKSLEDILRK